MDEALVEHAEHDIHRHHRGNEQEHLIAERRLERRRGALERGHEAVGQADVLLGLLDGVDRFAERNARREY